jgi:predicted small lipoprotein YifL
MLRAFAAAVRLALLVAALAAPAAGCGIKGPLRPPPGATPPASAPPSDVTPQKPTASSTRVEPDEAETKP